MNNYKKKIKPSESADSCVVDASRLSAWYSDVMSGKDVRSRMSVSGFNISRGAFGGQSYGDAGSVPGVNKPD